VTRSLLREELACAVLPNALVHAPRELRRDGLRTEPHHLEVGPSQASMTTRLVAVRQSAIRARPVAEFSQRRPPAPSDPELWTSSVSSSVAWRPPAHAGSASRLARGNAGCGSGGRLLRSSSTAGEGDPRSLRTASIGVPPSGRMLPGEDARDQRGRTVPALGAQPGPPVAEQRPTDGLERRPAPSVGGGHRHPNHAEVFAAADAGQL
jgi:hypothetical protein